MKYEEPNMEVIIFAMEDVATTRGGIIVSSGEGEYDDGIPAMTNLSGL